MTRRIRREGVPSALPRLMNLTIPLKTTSLAIWPLIGRSSTSPQPKYLPSSFWASISTSRMKSVPW